MCCVIAFILDVMLLSLTEFSKDTCSILIPQCCDIAHCGMHPDETLNGAMPRICTSTGSILSICTTLLRHDMLRQACCWYQSGGQVLRSKCCYAENINTCITALRI